MCDVFIISSFLGEVLISHPFSAFGTRYDPSALDTHYLTSRVSSISLPLCFFLLKDIWDSISDQKYFSLEGLRDLLSQVQGSESNDQDSHSGFRDFIDVFLPKSVKFERTGARIRSFLHAVAADLACRPLSLHWDGMGMRLVSMMCGLGIIEIRDSIFCDHTDSDVWC